MDSRRLTALAALAIGLISLFLIVNGRFFKGQNDFVGLYIGGALAATPQLYSYPDGQRLVTTLVDGTIPGIAFVRPPFYAAILRPLAALPYPAAWWTFFAIVIAGLFAFLRAFARNCPELPLIAALAPATISAVSNGQDTPLVLALAGAAVWLLRRDRPFAAGLLFALCGIKFHLFLLVPIVLIAKRQWRTLAGLAAGSTVLLALGAIVCGPRSYLDWLTTLRNPAVTPKAMLTNLESISTLPTVEIALAAAILACFAWLCWKSQDLEFLLGIALIAGLLLNLHAYVSDSVLLLLAFALIRNPKLRLALMLPLSPIGYFLVFGPSTAPYVLAILAVLPLAVALNGWSRTPAPASQPAATGFPSTPAIPSVDASHSAAAPAGSPLG